MSTSEKNNALDLMIDACDFDPRALVAWREFLKNYGEELCPDPHSGDVRRALHRLAETMGYHRLQGALRAGRLK